MHSAALRCTALHCNAQRCTALHAMHSRAQRSAPGAHVKLPCMQRFPRRVPWSTREYLSMSRLHPTAAFLTTVPSQCTCCGLAAAWRRAAGARKHCRSTCVGARVHACAAVLVLMRACVRACGFAGLRACFCLCVRCMDMQTFHHHMLHTTLRTRNPHEATLFYIPVYAVSCATRRVANQTRSVDPSRGPTCGLCARMNMTHDARGLLPRLDICAGCAHTLVRQHTS